MKTSNRYLTFTLFSFLSAPALAFAEPPRDAVYTMTNRAASAGNPAGNELIVYRRAWDGRLALDRRVATGGQGDGLGLGSQGALFLDDQGQDLYVVNPGSDEISVFQVSPRGVDLVDTVSSGGPRPISVTASGDRVYVLNGGRGAAEGNLAGFTRGQHGRLIPLAQAPTPLGGTNAVIVPSQLSFSPDGNFLVLSTRGSQQVITFAVNADGTLETADSLGTERASFGFAMNRDRLVVSEANGSVSSYLIDDTGGIEVVEREAGQASACWVAITRDGRFALVANTGSQTLSSFRLTRDGRLDAVELAVPTGSAGPGDLALSRDGAFLYARMTNNTIGAYRVTGDGHLELIETYADGLSINGIAAH